MDINFFGSFSSPYCYLALDRLDELGRLPDTRIVMQPVLPGVLRMKEYWTDTPEIARTYLNHDVVRTAEFLGLSYQHPDPSPIAWEEAGVWKPASDQRLIYRLYNMLYEAKQAGKCYALYSSLMRLIWSGQTPGWNEGGYLAERARECGLSPDLSVYPDSLTEECEAWLVANENHMLACGHWGVPTFTLNDEPFYGQDRLDQLRWRIVKSAG